MGGLKSLLALLFIVQASSGQSSATSTAACASTIAPKNALPSVATGWNVQVVASGLKDPRGIIFDSSGHLLVVQQGYGISSLRLTNDSGACVRADGKAEDIIVASGLNHGIELSADGKTLYASSSQAVYSWDYDAAEARNTSGPRELIGQMGAADGHVTRTLLLSRRVEGMLLVSRGSMSNLDPAAQDITTGVSTIKAFNVSNLTDSSYNYAQDGLLLGWGLRNSVGMAEEPITGAIYSVENSVDNFEREGQNIHQNNPGEEMNFHGYLNGTRVEEQGQNYGYPSCYAAWDVGSIPQNQGIQVGTQFAIGDQNATINDTFCRDDRIAPRLTFAAHMAPLDMKFNADGTAAWVTFHGSWNRDEPIGYKLSVIEFENGSPTDAANSSTAAIDVVSNPDVTKCPDDCFRPVGLAWDSQGRLFMSSDTTGEIYVVVPVNGSANEASPSSGLPPSATGAVPSSSSSGSAVHDFGKAGPWAALFVGMLALPLV
ncbi:soluble quino protein glucose dehydrogenase [Lindgomyces ingoldianus]|uniref:Soluble quino protein glucose dehydrogenase n=1 Tax=Lindgomyces ingoldianus TaxID=673940 RepID=A0ACB6R126_9PLEO|nr:soluble quino protein glucose dehydrogenase [Lindgomyces ingoldianus]KAF2472212.1 soluble quino protein glucose dehydrogenase [Lindgomyces ingoldianus]